MGTSDILLNATSRLGTVSCIILSDDLTRVIVMKDFEKSSGGRNRLAIPTGNREAEDGGDIILSVEREVRQEVFPEDLPRGEFPIEHRHIVKIPGLEKVFPDGTKHEYFVTLLSTSVPLKTIGTWETVFRDGNRVEMEVLGPPEWAPIKDILFLSPTGRTREWFLHYTHLRAVVEALFFLYGKYPTRSPVQAMWGAHGETVASLRRTFASR